MNAPAAKPPAGPAPKRVVPPIASVLVRSDGAAKPILPGLVVLFRTATLSPLPEKARAAARTGDAPAPTPPRLFSAGMVDRRGYLVPWEKLREQRGQRKAVTTDSLKFIAPPSSDATYDFFFVSHPDPARIQAILDNVNAHEGTFVGPRGAAVAPVASRLLRGEGRGGEHVLEVPEDPAKILPREGSELYGGWLLYRDMPHQGCARVAAHLEALQRALGAMRYPLGSGDDPYLSEPKVNRGLFDVRTWNAVLSLQRTLLGVSAPGAEARPSHALGLVKTDSVARLAGVSEGVAFAEIALRENDTGHVAASAVTPRPTRADGVVDDATAQAIKRCVDQGLRKPGDVLRPFSSEMGAGSYRWLRGEAVEALEAWRALASAFGWEQGIHAFHTYRSALADVTAADYGRATLSVHKSGYAIDLQMTGYVVPWTDALFYEKVDVGDRVRWRLWGRIPADREKLGRGLDEVARILAERHARVRPGSPLDAATLSRHYRACLDAEVPGGPAFREAAQRVSAALALDRGDGYDRLLEHDVEHLLDDEVTAFEYQRDHPGFSRDEAVFFVTKTAPPGHVFLCLTALARLVRLAGIRAFADGWHSTRKRVALAPSVTLPPTGAEAFAAVASTIHTANKRYDEDLIADRGAALVDHVRRCVLGIPEKRLGSRPRRGVFVPNEGLDALVGEIPASAFNRQLRPLFGSELDAGDAGGPRAVRVRLEEILTRFARAAVAFRAQMLVTREPKGKEVEGAWRSLAAPYRDEVDHVIDAFEAERPLDSTRLWHVRITRGERTTEVPLRDLDDGLVSSLGEWAKRCKKMNWLATPSVVFTDVKARVDPGTRAVTVVARQPRLEGLAAIRAAMPGLTLKLATAWFVADAPSPAKGAAAAGKTSKRQAPPVVGHVVSHVDLAPSGDLVAAVTEVLEAAYAQETAVRHVPALIVTPCFDAPLDIREGDAVEVTYPGEPIGMEWWHHQYHPALQGEDEQGAGDAKGPRKWSALLTDIGWELDVLGAGPGAAAYEYPGVGYSAKDLEKNAS